MSQKALILSFISVFLCTPFFVLAADMTMETGSRAGKIEISVYADTVQKEPFNAAEASILFDDNIFEVSHIDTSDSIFNLWTMPPKITAEGNIVFSGGTSGKGGFIFKGKLFSFVLEPKEDGKTTFSFEDPKVLAHDGTGTNILSDAKGLTLVNTHAIPKEYDTDGNGTVSLYELSVGMAEK